MNSGNHDELAKWGDDNLLSADAANHALAEVCAQRDQLTARVADAEAWAEQAKARIDEIWYAFNEHGHVPPKLSYRQHHALLACRPAAAASETATGAPK